MARGIDTWLKQSLATAQGDAAGATSSTSAATADAVPAVRKKLKQAAAAMKEAAASGNTALTLDDFPGKTLPQALGDMQSLQALIVRGTALTELPDNIGAMQRLTTLTQTGGKYERLPGSLTELKNLNHLELRDVSRLRALPETLGQLKNLRFLTVQSARRLQSLPASLTDLRLLRELDLQNNKRLEKLPIALGKLRGLASLYLNGCSALRELPASIGDLSNLRTLDLRGTGITRLPRTLARLPAHCNILVPESLNAQLEQIRNPQAAGAAGPSHAVRRPANAPSRSAVRPDARLTELGNELRRIDEDLARHFERWAQGLSIQGRFGAQRLTHDTIDMVEEVVAEAVGSETYRSSFAEFVDAHAPRQRNPLDGVTIAGGAPEIEGDVRTAYSHLLEHRILHTKDREEALSLVTQALQDPEMRMSRHRLLEEWDPVALREQMWPPLRAYVTLHDKKGAAAMEKAAGKAVAAFEKAEKGRMTDNAASERNKKEQGIANAAIQQRAAQLVKEWGFTR